MTQIVLDEARSQLGIPSWKVKPESYPGEITLETTPRQGKFRRWLSGVSRPLNWRPSGPSSWEAFSAMKHYRNSAGGLFSATGAFVGVLEDARLPRITDEVELRTLWEASVRRSRRTEVSSKDRAYAWHLASDDDSAGNALVHFSCFWKVEFVKDDRQSVTLRFVPSFLAQLRHFFTLKPWDATVYVPQPTH